MKANVNFKHWFLVACHSGDIESLGFDKLTRPETVAGVKTPESLMDMTLGQMVALSELNDGREMFYKVCAELLKLEPKQVDNARAVDVVRFVGWVCGKVKKINSMFEKIKTKPSDKEVQAGISQLNFGVFGIVDWYAKRMGISDHEQVFGVPWVRVYKCLEMDNKTVMYNKRLQEIMSKG